MDAERHNLLKQAAWLLRSMAASDGWGPDLAWFASDRDGHIAMMTTAGLGAVPAPVARDAGGLVGVIEAIETATGERFDLKWWGFRKPPESGLYWFDYRDTHGELGQYVAGKPYRRYAEPPRRPLTMGSLPLAARKYLNGVSFGDVCFAETTGLVIEDAFAEIYRPTMWDQWSDPRLLRPVAPRPTPPREPL